MLKFPRRQFLHLAAGAAALPAVSRTTWAQAYPSRPVRWIVGFAAGGGTDIVARLIGQWLSDRLGQQFIIENRPGAANNIGTEAVVNAAPDGYTILLANVSNAINAALYEKLKFNNPLLPKGAARAKPAGTASERDHPGHNGPWAALRAIQRWCYNPATAAGCPLGARRWP